MVRRLLDWFFFWRHKQLPPPEKPILELGSPSVIRTTGAQPPEPMEQESVVERNSPSTEVKAVMVVGAATTHAIEHAGPRAIVLLTGSVEPQAQRTLISRLAVTPRLAQGTPGSPH